MTTDLETMIDEAKKRQAAAALAQRESKQEHERGALEMFNLQLATVMTRQQAEAMGLRGRWWSKESLWPCAVVEIDGYKLFLLQTRREGIECPWAIHYEGGITRSQVWRGTGEGVLDALVLKVAELHDAARQRAAERDQERAEQTARFEREDREREQRLAEATAAAEAEHATCLALLAEAWERQSAALWRWPEGVHLPIYRWRWCEGYGQSDDGEGRFDYETRWSTWPTSPHDWLVLEADTLGWHPERSRIRLIPEVHRPTVESFMVTSVDELAPELKREVRFSVQGIEWAYNQEAGGYYYRRAEGEVCTPNEGDGRPWRYVVGVEPLPWIKEWAHEYLNGPSDNE